MWLCWHQTVKYFLFCDTLVLLWIVFEIENMDHRIKIYSVLFSLAVAVDWILHIFWEANEIVNWNSLIHSGWVVFSALMLLLFAFVSRKRVGYFGLCFYFVIFSLSFLNQFLLFSETLNYNCTLFNLGLFTAYYFSASDWELSVFGGWGKGYCLLFLFNRSRIYFCWNNP